MIIKSKPFLLFVVFSILLAACAGPAGGPPNAPVAQDNAAQPAAVDAVQSMPSTESSPNTSASASTDQTSSDAEHHSDVDLTHLEIGNGKDSTSPQVGYVYSCKQYSDVSFTAKGSWFNADGTWDATKKLTVDGSVNWPSSFTVTVQGDQRVFTSNDLPNHPTGNFPINQSDDAYQFDRNPGSISEQSIRLSFPANPVATAQPNCVGGEVGIMLSGVLIFNAFDADGHDAAANEVQDDCNGHPQKTGIYHYHNLSDCLEDTTIGHSALMGYAFDGYGIYGFYDNNGAEVTNADLDVCHGHTETVEWDGQMVEMYHYHATHEFPYVVGCFHGTSSQHGPIGGTGGEQQVGQGQGGQTQAQPATSNQPTQSDGQGNGQQPPQAAIDACANLTLNAACSMTTPNGSISGTCGTPPNSSQMACMPAGGPPNP